MCFSHLLVVAVGVVADYPGVNSWLIHRLVYRWLGVAVGLVAVVCGVLPLCTFPTVAFCGSTCGAS